MSDRKCHRLDTIAGYDQMAEKPPKEEARRRFRTQACYKTLDDMARRKNKNDRGEK